MQTAKQYALLQLPLPDLELVRVEGHQEGEHFLMGASGNGSSKESPSHPVHIGYDFYMGRFPVTQALYLEVMNRNPSRYKGGRRPVENIAWYRTQDMIEQLNALEKVKNDLIKLQLPTAKFRLPTEAEWEFAARGGRYSQGYTYSGGDDLKQLAWYKENSGIQTQAVGLQLPNELGLYDMSGNVYEWCEDNWHTNYNGAPDDGSAWINEKNEEEYRVLRGGNHWYGPDNCRSTYRHGSPATDGYRGFFYIGFRLLLAES